MLHLPHGDSSFFSGEAFVTDLLHAVVLHKEIVRTLWSKIILTGIVSAANPAHPHCARQTCSFAPSTKISVLHAGINFLYYKQAFPSKLNLIVIVSGSLFFLPLSMKKSNPNVCNVSLHECILHCWNRLGMEIAVDVELKLITPKLHCVAKSLALKFFANASPTKWQC